MNAMTVDSMDAPWWDDSEWICPICAGKGYFFAGKIKQCPHCHWDGEIEE